VGRRAELITLSEDTGASSAVETPEAIHEESGLPMRRRLIPFGLTSAPKTALHQGFLSLADQAVASITNFVTGVIIARSSSKEEFGLYMLGFSLILLTTDLQTSLIATPYMVYAPRLKGRAHALYAGSTLMHQVVFSLLGMVALACAAVTSRFGIGPRGLGPVLWALGAMVGLIMLREFVRRMCFAALKLRSVLVFDICIGLAQVGGLLLLAHLGVLSASVAYWLIGPVCGIAALAWLWLENRFFHLRLSQSVADLKTNWTFGRWVFASGLVYTASANLYPWLLAFFHGAAAAGVFAACVGVVSASNPALLGLQNFVGPKTAHEFAAKGQQGLRRFVLKLSAMLAIPAGLLALVLILWGDRFVALLYGSRYSGNGMVVAVLAVNLLVSAVGFSFSRALLAMERASVDFGLNLVALVTMLTLGLWLVRTHGALGAAIGLLGANFATSLVKAGIFLQYPAHSRIQQEVS
jgi:O-antigen/teichoic acid export membrane protein